MENDKSPSVALTTEDSWVSLRRYTDARIGLGRSGSSLTTEAHLAFQLAHAKARDAVHIPLDLALLQQQLENYQLSSVPLHSRAYDRAQYLQRPDKGRRLAATSADLLRSTLVDGLHYDVTVVLADGLSSAAVQQHGALMASLVTQRLKSSGLSCSPVCLVEQGRVAIGDDIGEILASRLLIMLIGERPGLSSPDSLGLYYTFQPRLGLTDEARNCISNIRPAGLRLQDAAERLMWLVNESLRLRLSGVGLKDKSQQRAAISEQNNNFLLD
jgi:ethanolamine ammonia-lyase small subunit